MVALDGRTAMEGLFVRESRPGQCHTDLLHDSIAAAKRKRRNLELTLRSVTDHQDIAGNEQVDIQVKLATAGNSSSIRLLLAATRKTLPVSSSKAKQVPHKALEAQATDLWREGGTKYAASGLRHAIVALPEAGCVARATHYLTTDSAPHRTCIAEPSSTHDRPRRHAAMSGAAKGSVLHFVLRCPKYALQRRVYFGPLGRNGQRPKRARIDCSSTTTRRGSTRHLASSRRQSNGAMAVDQQWVWPD